MPFISIQLNSNRPAQIAAFFDAIEATADTPQDIEVLLHIDEGDSAMEAVVAEEKVRRKFDLRVLSTKLVTDYSSLWKPLNALFAMTHKDAYFVINLSDEILFATKGWDSIVRSYKGYYPDDIFRLRASQFRYRNYNDLWQCGFAPDSVAFYTRRWLELQGDWNPCMGPDSFQQCVAYYLMTADTYSHTQFNRDIPLAFVHMLGEGANAGMDDEARRVRSIANNRMWFILMSYRMQQEAKRRAMLLRSHMIMHQYGGPENVELSEDKARRRFYLTHRTTGKQLARGPYRLWRLRVWLRNFRRAPFVLYYGGGGKKALERPFSSSILMVCTYTPRTVALLQRCKRILARA